ncbi:hypothetical protein MSBRW_3656 [Methanosarcina barkeri str. Wiesmoor]|uniref:Uncharacterized protein n=1 Tax=Methanosarcina barkeri str. Wiesmoor TaxID=1434109 RepID=A0A0E3QQF6_METBA|nr:hypothetical protein [Methanosarcina barkeri]AKB52909.1 hypothetical protein MSBRW_3656 [Methanosarcina barkeri str. Wiesmoor]
MQEKIEKQLKTTLQVSTGIKSVLTNPPNNSVWVTKLCTLTALQNTGTRGPVKFLEIVFVFVFTASLFKKGLSENLRNI